jgi:hypothetical protein
MSFFPSDLDLFGWTEDTGWYLSRNAWIEIRGRNSKDLGGRKTLDGICLECTRQKSLDTKWGREFRRFRWRKKAGPDYVRNVWREYGGEKLLEVIT